jgi:hypothetical protein
MVQMHRTLVPAFAAAFAAAGLLFAACAHAQNGASASPCSQIVVSQGAVSYRVLFAKNGAVQRYVLVRSTGNVENDHDVLIGLQGRYGPEEVNAPPLRIVSYRQGSGGMRIPQKAVDSCGRVTQL